MCLAVMALYFFVDVGVVDKSMMSAERPCISYFIGVRNFSGVVCSSRSVCPLLREGVVVHFCAVLWYLDWSLGVSYTAICVCEYND